MQQFTFVELKIGELRGWYGEINKPDELLSFLNTFIVPKAVDGIKDYCRSVQEGGHYRYDYGRICKVIHTRRHDKNLKTSIFELSQEIDDILLKPKLKAIESGPIYVGISGGWCTLGSKTEIVQRITSSTFPSFGIKDIRIIKWEDGKHFYAKIGNQDVVEYDIHGFVLRQKWNSEQEARSAAEKFFERKYNKT